MWTGVSRLRYEWSCLRVGVRSGGGAGVVGGAAGLGVVGAPVALARGVGVGRSGLRVDREDDLADGGLAARGWVGSGGMGLVGLMGRMGLMSGCLGVR